eukprot:gene29068-50576_t
MPALAAGSGGNNDQKAAASPAADVVRAGALPDRAFVSLRNAATK